MNVLMLSAWEDTGGIQAGLKQALERYTDWSVRAVTRHQNYINYLPDIFWEPNTPMPDGLQDLFDAADVIHVQEQWSAVTPFAGWREKPLLMHHHGTIFRQDQTAELLRTVREYRAYTICSTPDLQLIDPSIEWLPNPCDIAYLRLLREKSRDVHVQLRIAHSPTNRYLKATDGFLAAVQGLPLEVDLIEWVTWQECLARKARADLFYDQLHIGYALSGIEAMAMGIPVIGGAYDRRIIDLMSAKFDYLPFLLATPETLRDRLEHLLDPDVQRLVASVGREHVERWHDEGRVARQLVEIYAKTLALRA